ncbi:unnamed protein product [Trifolium pratense]|uniref:Uncharacterized protein n=1 Tax=Trifolium pratense TaxID=57577 RepID=A0ACB0K600_TRIPR|nr:unnamed protein product [Trifolium pratense]
MGSGGEEELAEQGLYDCKIRLGFCFEHLFCAGGFWACLANLLLCLRHFIFFGLHLSATKATDYKRIAASYANIDTDLMDLDEVIFDDFGM